MFQWIKSAFKRGLENPAVPLNSPAASAYLGAPRSASGAAVNKTTVLGLPAVKRGVELVSNKIGRLPLNVYKRTKKGAREIDGEHHADWLLNYCPSNLYTPVVFRSVMQSHVMLHGNAYAWIMRNDLGKPEELIILNPDFVGVALTNGQLLYYYKSGTYETKILPENILHIKGVCVDGIGIWGASIIDLLRETFGLGIALNRHAAVYFRNNGSPGPQWIKFSGKKTKEQLKEVRDNFNNVHIGLDNANKIGFLTDGADLVTGQVNNEQAQFLESRQFNLIEIANVLGVPPYKLGAEINTSYKSLEAESRDFVSDSVDYWLVSWEQECSKKLLRQTEQERNNRFIAFDRRSLYQTDTQTLSDTQLAELNGGLKTLNELRDESNLPPLEDGDRLRMPTNVTFADLVDDIANDPDTNEPDSPDENAAGVNPGTKEPVSDEATPNESPDPENSTPSRYRELVANVLQRQFRRWEKALEAAQRKPAYDPAVALEEHRQVALEALPTVSQAGVGKLLEQVAEEARAVLPEQLPEIFKRLNAQHIAERLINE